MNTRSAGLRILFVSREYPPETNWGGIASYVLSTGAALAERGHEVHVLSCVPDQVERDYFDHGMHVHRRDQTRFPLMERIVDRLRLPFLKTRILTGLATYREYRRLGLRFDIVEYPDWGAEGWMIAARHREPLVCQLHTPLNVICTYLELQRDIDKRLSSTLERFAAEHADTASSPSQLLVRELKRDGWLAEVHPSVIPLTIDWAYWAQAESAARSRPVALCVGRLMHAKAPEVLVEAMAIVRKAVPNAEALFVGGSNERNGMPYVEWIRKSYPNMEGCRFVGHTPSDEVIRYMSECRAVVVTSRYDSFNLAALEGIAAGRPVVVTSTAGIAEVLNKLSECAVVEPNDPQALAQALIPLLADASRAAAVGDAARDKVRPLLDPAAIAATRERLYYDAINSFRRGRKRN